MSVGSVLGGIAVEVAKEAIQWALGKAKEKAKQAGLDVDDKVVAAFVEAEMLTLYVATRAMAISLDYEMTKLEEAERKFRASSNVEVVTELPK